MAPFLFVRVILPRLFLRNLQILSRKDSCKSQKLKSLVSLRLYEALSLTDFDFVFEQLCQGAPKLSSVSQLLS